MRKTGRIYSVDISAGWLVFFFSFMACFTLLSILTINWAANLFWENKKLEDELRRTSRALEEYQFQSQVLYQYQQLVEELNKTEGSEKKEVAAKPVRPVTEIEQSAEEQEPPSSAGAGTATKAEGLENSPIEALKLTVQAESDNAALRFQFSLRNVHPDNKGIGGYLFIVIANMKSNPPVLIPYPDVALANGDPVDYKKGTLFNIRYGKTVRGKVKNLTKAGDFTQAWIFAYSETGELILKSLLTAEHD
ncbi:MAG: hypothetical protein V1816_07715 [Pseudomonadota bacterium]